MHCASIFLFWVINAPGEALHNTGLQAMQISIIVLLAFVPVKFYLFRQLMFIRE